MNTTPFALGEIGQIALTVRSQAVAKPFYRDILGLKHLFDAPPSLSFYQCGSVRLMLSEPEGGTAPSGGNSVIYFRVPDIQATHAELLGRGAKFERDPQLVAKMPDHDLWMGFLRDPEGNLIGLMSEVRKS